MKKLIWVFIFIAGLSFSENVSAQTAKTKKTPSKSARKTMAAPKMSPPAMFEKTSPEQREKFDPKRDPAADLRAAVARAQKENKRIILDVGGEWCVWCVKMDVYFFENKALASFRDDNFIWVKVNFSPENENREFLAGYPAPEGYPHLYVLETDGSLLHSQGTAELEEQPQLLIRQGEADNRTKNREKSYDIVKFVEFLKRWSSE